MPIGHFFACLTLSIPCAILILGYNFGVFWAILAYAFMGALTLLAPSLLHAIVDKFQRRPLKLHPTAHR